MDRALLITNADAGTNDRESVDLALAELGASLDVEVAATQSLGDLDEALAAKDGRLVVVAGGDGSLHAVIASLHRRGELADTRLGLVPLGTGNDFARALRIPLDPAGAAAVVTSGRESPLDLLVDDDDHVVVNAVHIGVGVDAAREAERWKRRLGKLGYPVGAAMAGFKGARGHRLSVIADGHVITGGSRRTLQVGIGNGAFIGGGTPLIPDADPGDGQADLMLSFAATRTQRLLYVVHLKLGTHGERHNVQILRATRIDVSGRGFSYNADGELSARTRKRTWQLRPAAYTMRLPTPEQAAPT